jgi:hypothetical protein
VGRSSVSIGTARYYKGKAIGNSELVSYSSAAEEVSQCLEAERVSLRQCVSESSSVSLRNLKSTALAVNYSRRKPVFRRVTVISPVR